MENKNQWEDFGVEKIQMKQETIINELKYSISVHIKALSFIFTNGKVSIYKGITTNTLTYSPGEVDKWAMSAWDNQGRILFTRYFYGLLHEIPQKKFIELSSMLNASKIANRNSPAILIDMGTEMSELASRISHKKTDPLPEITYSQINGDEEVSLTLPKDRTIGVEMMEAGVSE